MCGGILQDQMQASSGGGVNLTLSSISSVTPQKGPVLNRGVSDGFVRPEVSTSDLDRSHEEVRDQASQETVAPDSLPEVDLVKVLTSFCLA